MTKLMSQHRLAEAIGVHPRTVANYIDQGRISAVKIGRLRRIPE